jgi:DNA-directed RNA polymerase subunit beta'
MVAKILDVGGAEIASYKVDYGSKMLVKDGQSIKRG